MFSDLLTSNREKLKAQARARYKRNPEIAEKARKWREDNPDKVKENARRTAQRRRDKLVPKYCSKCNIEIERKYRSLCRPCYSIHEKEMKKFHNDKGAEKRKLKYENRDKDAYNAYFRNYFRKNRAKVLYIQKRFQERQKRGWYKLRLESIEKNKKMLELYRKRDEIQEG